MSTESKVTLEDQTPKKTEKMEMEKEMVDHRNDRGIRGEYFAFVSRQPPTESDFGLKLY